MASCTICGASAAFGYASIYGNDMCRPCFAAFVEGKLPLTEIVRGGGSFATEATTRMGTNAESRFRELCIQKSFPLRNATSYENRILHYDFIVKKTHDMFSRVEVKAMKAAYRGGAPNAEIIYIETKNVIGEKGWVYGAADDIAFEQPWGFIIVPRVSLVAMTEYYKSKATRAHVSGIPYTLYGRKDRQDEVLILPTRDLYRITVSKFA